MWSKIYPVGAIYISTSPTSPQTLFGGTWEAINGRFLVAHGSNGQSGNAALNLSAGAMGGEANHTLSEAEMPSHYHTGLTDLSLVQNGNYYYAGTWLNPGHTPQQGEIRTDSKGSSSPHNNLPPYLSVYMWKRTA